ncbi:ribonuclease H-like YkuK family protein [Psychroflexus salinarum]|uniref:Ribonuclease H-like YkuK family protein n=1 Tax=Psychroflexus salinarum TaxID=546024 RepID=A0ABW3GLA9_9FLAO
MLFKKLTSDEPFDVARYVKQYSTLYEGQKLRIYLGCDSQNRLQTTYATTLVFNVASSGCHIIYKKEIVPLISDMWTRLWGEAERSVEVALYLRENGIEIDTIDLDYNVNPKYKSNKVVTAAVGYVESLGFKARIKLELLPAVYAADNIVG